MKRVTFIFLSLFTVFINHAQVVPLKTDSTIVTCKDLSFVFTTKKIVPILNKVGVTLNFVVLRKKTVNKNVIFTETFFTPRSGIMRADIISFSDKSYQPNIITQTIYMANKPGQSIILSYRAPPRL